MSPVNRAHTRLDQLRFPDVVQISTLDGLQYTIQLLHAIRQNCPETCGFFFILWWQIAVVAARYSSHVEIVDASRQSRHHVPTGISLLPWVGHLPTTMSPLYLYVNTVTARPNLFYSTHMKHVLSLHHKRKEKRYILSPLRVLRASRRAFVSQHNSS